MRKIISLIIIAVPTTIPRTNIILPHLFFHTLLLHIFLFLYFCLLSQCEKNPLHFLEIKHFHDAYKSDI